VIFELVLMVSYLSNSGIIGEESHHRDAVAVINYNREVTEKYTSKVIDRLEEIRGDSSYRSLLFIMNSGGGSPTASEELSQYLKDFQRDKNITIYIESIAASGGYYIASAVKPIYANRNAVVGSIGVVMPHYSLKGLAQKLGIEEDYLTAGEFKRPISLMERVDEKSREYIERHLLIPTYQNFLEAVAENRDLTIDELKPFADGKIFIANMDEIKGILVDEISTLHRVKEMIRDRVGDSDLEFVDIEVDRRIALFPKLNISLNIDGLKDIFMLK